MIDAVYTFNEYLAPFVHAIDAAVEFVPGDSGDTSSGTEFITYNVRPNTDFYLRMYHLDIVNYRVVHSDFDKLSRIVDAIITNTNIDDPEGVIIGSGIRFQETFARSTGTLNDFFETPVEYFAVFLQVTLNYTMV